MPLRETIDANLPFEDQVVDELEWTLKRVRIQANDSTDLTVSRHDDEIQKDYPLVVIAAPAISLERSEMVNAWSAQLFVDLRLYLERSSEGDPNRVERDAMRDVQKAILSQPEWAVECIERMTTSARDFREEILGEDLQISYRFTAAKPTLLRI